MKKEECKCREIARTEYFRTKSHASTMEKCLDENWEVLEGEEINDIVQDEIESFLEDESEISNQ